ncbi:MAG: hypothetical protein VCB42_06855, partial [Myxococcota bacterium]
CALPIFEEIYGRDPQLKILELQSRVFVCLLAVREACAAEADQLLAMDPGNIIATNVRKKLTTGDGM